MKTTKNNDALMAISVHLKKHGLTLCTIESCTGGNIASRITSISGASDYFLGSLVPYSTEIKIDVLRVSKETITEHSEVSIDTAREMLLCGLTLFKAQVGIATTGFAGPTGGNDKYPIGSVIVASGSKEDHDICVFHYPEMSRDAVINRSTEDSITFFAKQLLG